MEDLDSFPSSSFDIQVTPKKHHKQQTLPSRTPEKVTKVPVTDRSHLDYTIYAIQSSNDELIALIIETKMSKLSQHVHAQVSFH